MNTKEKPYDDKEIEVRGETVKLSELTKEERDLYFAGKDDGSLEGVMYALYIVLVVLAVAAIISLAIHK